MIRLWYPCRSARNAQDLMAADGQRKPLALSPLIPMVEDAASELDSTPLLNGDLRQAVMAANGLRWFAGDKQGFLAETRRP